MGSFVTTSPMGIFKGEVFFMATKYKQNRNMTVWVVPYSRLETEPMKEDSFGYNDWDIYHG